MKHIYYNVHEEEKCEGRSKAGIGLTTIHTNENSFMLLCWILNPNERYWSCQAGDYIVFAIAVLKKILVGITERLIEKDSAAAGCGTKSLDGL